MLASIPHSQDLDFFGFDPIENLVIPHNLGVDVSIISLGSNVGKVGDDFCGFLKQLFKFLWIAI